MGAYLNKPITEKHSESGEGEGLKYGATCVQGWRVSQEDAHNCHLQLAEDWNLFAVYDGHGGSEVSKYTALNFPEFLKNKEFWKQEDLVKTLETAFVDFDDHIRSEPVMKELLKIQNEGKEKPEKQHDSEDEDDRIQTIEESKMPLEQILARYGYSIIRTGGDSKNLFVEHEDDEEEGKVKEKKKRHSKSPAQSQAKRAKTDSDNNAAEGKTGEPAEKEEKTAEEGEKNETEDGPVNAKDSAAGSVSDSDDKVENEDSEDESDADFEEGDEDDEDEEDEAEDEDEEEGEEIFIPGGGDVPGDDSGTTACVCLISKTKVVVANAGDSRAVLSRGGIAVNLSVDHKPEDECERTRIEKAGGCVNGEGRVNGGLNLSRALGDHCYKKNTDLKLEEQMISALPDVKIEELKPEDEFVVVACDGIWNSLESQEVVDFVKERFTAGKSCQTIAEELCDHCLADSTAGDGTGCDNMTVIITQLSH